MMDYQEILVILAKELRPARFRHSREVSRTAVRLAERWGVDIEKARLAGILHDCARNLKGKELLKCAAANGLPVSEIEILQPALIHAPLGSLLAERRFGVADPEILLAIARHTTGAAQMSPLDKIIYLADCIEPGRHYPGVDELRALAEQDLDAAVLLAYDHSISFVLAGGGLLHPNTVDGRNSLLLEMKAKHNGK